MRCQKTENTEDFYTRERRVLNEDTAGQHIDKYNDIGFSSESVMCRIIPMSLFSSVYYCVLKPSERRKDRIRNKLQKSYFSVFVQCTGHFATTVNSSAFKHIYNKYAFQ